MNAPVLLILLIEFGEKRLNARLVEIRLVCVFVVRKQRRHVLSRQGLGTPV